MPRAISEAIALLILAFTLALAVNSLRPGGLSLTPPPPKTPLEEQANADGPVPIETAIEKHRGAGVLFIDARSHEDYTAGHIAGALNFSLHAFDQWVESFVAQTDPEQEIIVYCHGTDCPLAQELAETLRTIGYEKAGHLRDGWGEWLRLRQPVETGEHSGIE